MREKDQEEENVGTHKNYRKLRDVLVFQLYFLSSTGLQHSFSSRDSKITNRRDER
jgi:hypothetical protein